MSQDVNQDWNNREFNDSVELAVRKCVDFLNNFQESAKYRLSVVDQRLTSLERKLDFMEAQLKNCDPSVRIQKDADKKNEFKESIFDPEVRATTIQAKLNRRKDTGYIYTGKVIRPKKISGPRMIVGSNTHTGNVQRMGVTSPTMGSQTPQSTPDKVSSPRGQQTPSQPFQPQPQPSPVGSEKSDNRPRSDSNESNSSQKAEEDSQTEAKNEDNNAPKSSPIKLVKEDSFKENKTTQVKLVRQNSGGGVVRPQPPIPTVPSVPTVPNVPAVPTVPTVPSVPSVPSVPVVPSVPTVPTVPTVPNVPAVPSVPGVPGANIPPPPKQPSPVVDEKEGEETTQEPPKPEFPHGDPTRIDMLVIQAGTGPKAGPTGSVEIEYTGFLADGKQFIRHKEVIELGQRKNIKGLEQACTQIQEGSRVKLWIPSKLAYGSKGGGSLIPPNADLTFELQLLKVHRQ